MVKRLTKPSASAEAPRPRGWIWQQRAWPNLSWDNAKLANPLARARLRQGELLGIARLLDSGLSREAEAQILIQDGINTSAIEGEHVDVDAIRSSVARHLGLPTAGLRAAPRSVDGLVEVLLDATAHYAKPLTQKRLFGWQAALFPTGRSGLHKIRTGTLRGDDPMRVVSGSIGRQKVHFEAPPRKGLEAQVRGFIDWFNAPPERLDGLVRAGLAHLWFVTLHPFDDGNGRVARAITDMALCQDEQRPQRLFSLSAQIMRNRDAYYAVLERTQRGGLDVTPWLAWHLEQVSLACELADGTVAHVLAKARFWLRHQVTPLNDRQRKVINVLLDAGPGGFAGGMNTRKYVSLTRASRATAYRELADLVVKGCLIPSGGGRSVVYQIAWD
jgi:Fic family protein